jgi:hypothetical protein
MIAKVQTQTTSSSESKFAAVQSGVLQRKCDCGSHTIAGGECEECSKKPGVLLRQAITHGRPAVPGIVHEVLRSPGQPLDPATRAFFEPHFGHDFSRVRTHRDGRAGESARAVKAWAYTVGQDVVFGAGQYAPDTMAGRKLLAHELAHVVQQRDATYPVGGLTLADSTWEREADAAAEAAGAGRPAHVAQHVTGPQLARQKFHTETQTAPTGAAGTKVEVTRGVTAGKCAEVPKTRITADTEITRTHAAIELSYCRGRTRAGAKGELDYSDVVRRAVNAVPGLFTGGDPKQALSDLERSFKQAEPRANVRFELQVGGVKAKVTGTGKASIEGGASGEAEATVSGRVGTTGVEGGVTVSGGTEEETKVGVTIKITPGVVAPEIPNCFKCTCTDPTITFACVVHEPGTPGKTTPSPPPKETLYVPLFFEFEKTEPRTDWKDEYEKMLRLAVDRIREGYTIARIEGNASPEGPERPKRRGGFNNIDLAQARAVEAQNDLNDALKKAFTLSMRDTERLRAALGATYPVEGKGELFGATKRGEVAEKELFRHLQTTLLAPGEGETDKLAAAHVTGQGLPPEIEAEVEEQVAEFRTERPGEKKKSRSERLEAIFRPLRRALIVLNPPPAKPFSIQRPQEEIAKVVGKPMDKCLPEHEAVFLGKPIPNDWLYEGACRPKGGVGGKVE